MGKSEPMTALDPVEDLIAEMGGTRRCITALLDEVATLRAELEQAVRQQSQGYVRARPGTR
ncbi:hypothetical protein ACRC7T_04285 [Segnochrobactraceae bacterium EtOH-i3]